MLLDDFVRREQHLADCFLHYIRASMSTADSCSDWGRVYKVFHHCVDAGVKKEEIDHVMQRILGGWFTPTVGSLQFGDDHQSGS